VGEELGRAIERVEKLEATSVERRIPHGAPCGVELEEESCAASAPAGHRQESDL
jgi:hypothetical protein